jgi:hypothetical protein
MVHLLSQLDPMIYLMVTAFAIGFTVVAAVLVELLPKPIDEPTLTVPADGVTCVQTTPSAAPDLNASPTASALVGTGPDEPA